MRAVRAKGGRLRQGSLVYFLGFGRPVRAAEWTSVADELAPGSTAMSPPRTCWDRVRGCPAVVDSDLGGGGCGPSYVVTGGGRGIGRVLVTRLARVPRRDMIMGVLVRGMYASGPPVNVPPKPAPGHDAAASRRGSRLGDPC
jgi:hypothetical protein